jgi:hypothetical protein
MITQNFRVTKRLFAYQMNALYASDYEEKDKFMLWAFGLNKGIVTDDLSRAWNRLHGHEVMVNEDFNVEDIKKIIDLYEQYKRKKTL